MSSERRTGAGRREDQTRASRAKNDGLDQAERELRSQIERSLKAFEGMEARLQERMTQIERAAEERTAMKVSAHVERSLADADRRLRATADELVGQLAASLGAQAEALGRGARQLASEFARNPARAEPARPVAEDAAGPPPRDEAEQSGVSEGLQLLIAQMAADGNSREEIAALLRSDFGIRDATAAIAATLNPDPATS